MIQIYADGVLTYDSRREDYDLNGLKITAGLNKGGTAEIAMPPSHPAYNKYAGFRTIVEIYRDGALRFRGRALYPVDDYDNSRTVVCEGERCFLQDGVSRPYLYETNPGAIFAAVVAEYNAQVDRFKQFKLGNVTVTGPNEHVRFESEDAETVLDTVNKLIERCGGYIVFDTDSTGARRINWLASVGGMNKQIIDGENLLSFSRSGASSDPATALIPYGAKDETTGKRLTIADVNGGQDFIIDKAAARVYGLITKTATWDDVTEPANLLTIARDYLATINSPVDSLTLTALDLSYIDKSIESFKLGDLIRVTSNAHRVNTDFQLVETTEDLLNPENNAITLGKELRTLTSLDVAGDSKSQSAIQKVVSTVKSGIQGVDQQVTETLKGYAKTEALQEYATYEALQEYAKTEALAAYALTETLTAEIARLEERLAVLEAADQE